MCVEQAAFQQYRQITKFKEFGLILQEEEFYFQMKMRLILSSLS